MPASITNETIREVEPLRDDASVEYGARRVLESGLPALPVVDEQGKFVGIFGEREFVQAVFPGYVDTLASSRMIRRALDPTIEWRFSCRDEPVSRYLTTDHVVVDDDYADVALAETFLHHRVLIVPIATQGRVHAVVTRADFFRRLAERVLEQVEDYGD